MTTHSIAKITMAATLLLGVTSTSPAAAGTAAFDAQMKPLLAQYLKAHRLLAGDKTGGLAGAAKRIAQLTAKLDPSTVTGKHKAHYATLPAKIRTAAKKLAHAKSLANARAAFKQLSRPMAMWATMSKPAGVHVVFCSMAKASWLQASAKVRNPYYGKKMLSCGQVIGSKASGHMKH